MKMVHNNINAGQIKRVWVDAPTTIHTQAENMPLRACVGFKDTIRGDYFSIGFFSLLVIPINMESSLYHYMILYLLHLWRLSDKDIVHAVLRVELKAQGI